MNINHPNSRKPLLFFSFPSFISSGLTVLLKLFHVLSEIGVREHEDEIEQSRIILSNRIMLLCILNTAPFCLIFSWMQLKTLALGTLLICFLYCIPIFMNHLNFRLASNILICLFPMVSISLYFLYSGSQVGFHYILFFCSALGPLVFRPSERIGIYAAIAFSMILFFFFDLYGDRYVIEFMFADAYIPIVKFCSICVAFFCTLGAVSLYISQSVSFQDKRRREQYESKLALDSVMREIQIKNDIIDALTPKDAYVQLTQGVAHEIKSPMACLLSGAELLRMNVNNPDAIGEFSDLMIKTIKRLSKLTESMLNFSGKISSESEPFCLSKMVQELVILSQHQCQRKRIQISYNCPQEFEFFGNRVFIAQALLNLVVNAIQFTPDGGKISCELYHYSKDVKSFARISVTDTGIGISDQDIPHIFKSNHTSGQSTHNMGMGLALVERVVHDHDGTISVESTIGKGTVFHLDFPIRHAA